MQNIISKGIAKMFKDAVKSEFPFADFKFTTAHNNGVDVLKVKFDGEVNVLRLWNIVEMYETDYLTITAEGVKRQLV